jgi:hypothetical protein
VRRFMSVFHVKPGMSEALKSLAFFHNPHRTYLISRYKKQTYGLLVLENMLLENRFFIAQASLEAVLH